MVLNSNFNHFKISFCHLSSSTCFFSLFRPHQKGRTIPDIWWCSGSSAGPVRCCVWAAWTCWTHSWSSAASALHPLRSRNARLSRMCEPETRAWSGIHILRWTPSPPSPPTSPLSFSLSNPPPTPSRPSPSATHPQLAAEDGFSESSWDPDQREITATSMQNVMWKPPSYVPTIDSSPSTSIPMLSVRPFLLISLRLFYRSAV